MAACIVLVDRDPLYAWFVTEALLDANTSVTWFRDTAAAVDHRPDLPGPALWLVDGVTWLTSSRGRMEPAAGPSPPTVLIGWDFRTTPPAGFIALGGKPADAGELRALVARALDAAAVRADTSAQGAA